MLDDKSNISKSKIRGVIYSKMTDYCKYLYNSENGFINTLLKLNNEDVFQFVR